MNLSKVKIRELMNAQGLNTFTQLAEKLGITKNQLSVMLSHDYNPLKTRVVQLCHCLLYTSKRLHPSHHASVLPS